MYIVCGLVNGHAYRSSSTYRSRIVAKAAALAMKAANPGGMFWVEQL